ncbi:CLL_collapsed_G0005780.mRNA.1.CDS.1 [Saccharomyces cerevisiae]|nr:CLL_collapsed_G0005780.mRNA.1.CDS.1 [Saccharomyces cerevisiae]
MKPQCILISLLVNLAYAEEYLVRFKNPTAFQQFTSNSNRSWRQRTPSLGPDFPPLPTPIRRWGQGPLQKLVQLLL